MKSKKIEKTICVGTVAVLALTAAISLAACDDAGSSATGAVELSGSEVVVQTNGDSVNVNVNVDMQGAFDLFHNHVYEATPMTGAEPTCTSDGYGYYTCSCGAQYSAVIPALGHDLYVAGDGLYRCANCGSIFSVVNDDGHSYSSEAYYVPASEDEDARWITFCEDSDCKYIKELSAGELSGYTRVVTAAEAFGDEEEPGQTAYGQSATDSYRVVESGKYIVKKDVVASLKIPMGADVEIDLCGKTITPSDAAAHTVFVMPVASLSITDSSASGAGTIFAGDSGAAIYNKEGDVDVSAGTIARVGESVYENDEDAENENDDEAGSESDRAFAVIENKGKMKIGSSVTVSATYSLYGTYTWTDIERDDEGNVVYGEDGNPKKATYTEDYEETGLLSDGPLIVNGYVDDSKHDEYMERDVGASLVIEGGKYNGGTCIENEVLASLEIYGNPAVACSEGCIKSYGDLSIYGGRFNAANGNVIEICGNEQSEKIVAEKGKTTVVYIEGGTFYDASTDYYMFAATSETGNPIGAKIYINGGTFFGGFGLQTCEDTGNGSGYVFDSLLIYAGEFSAWPGEADAASYTYEFLAEGCAVEKDMDFYVVQAADAGHVHDYEVVSWAWSGTTGSDLSCVLTLSCRTRFCTEKVVVLDAAVEDTPETIAATCEKGEISRYTATCTYLGVRYSDNYDVEAENTRLQHTYESEGSIAWEWVCEPGLITALDKYYGSCTFACDVCGDVYLTTSGSVSSKTGDVYVAEVTDRDGRTYWCTSDDRSTVKDYGTGSYSDYLESLNGADPARIDAYSEKLAKKRDCESSDGGDAVESTGE